jgi:hypothetical protein
VFSSKLKTPLLLADHTGFVYFALLACDRVRQKTYLELLPADDGRYNDKVES